MTDGIEADDMLAIRATELGDDSVMVTLDKDLDQVVGWHYNFVKKNKYFITKDEGLLNFYKQFLVGDRTDNIIGVKGIGDKKAHKLLEGQSEPEMWKTVVEHLGEERAIENGHLLYMLRHHTDSFAPPV
jgi:5'-3' exonuclease